ncbi:MAG: DUF3035 domain-containing protein [Rhodothalassiaceae bacterium]
MRLISFAASVAALTVLAGCAGDGTPDEFVVVAKPALEVPPDFALRPPRTGVATKQDINTQAQAIEALFPGRSELPALSRGERALLDQLGEVDRGARSQLRSEQDVVVRKDPLLADILAVDQRDQGLDGASIERVASDPQG